MVAVFIGHSECYGLSEKDVRGAIISAINNGVTEFFPAEWAVLIGCAPVKLTC